MADSLYTIAIHSYIYLDYLFYIDYKNCIVYVPTLVGSELWERPVAELLGTGRPQIAAWLGERGALLAQR